MRKPHHVPLSRQSKCDTRGDPLNHRINGFRFPLDALTCAADVGNTLNAALRRLSYASNEMTAHGFRAMANILLNESGKWSSDAIERALADGDGDKVRAAYHRGAHWKERVAMAQWWSDLLDTFRNGATILPFPEAMAS